MINNFFEHIFCVNLERRTDRLEEIKAELQKFNITVEFIKGVDGRELKIPDMMSSDGQKVSPGDIGCSQSHLKIARLAKERGIKKYFVLEDDAVFADNFNEVFADYMAQVPEDWQMLYLGGNHMGGYQQVKENVAKIFLTFTTHAYGVNGDAAIDGIIEVLGGANEKVDVAIATLHKRLQCYVFRPHLCFQRPSMSDILNVHTDYKHLYK